MTNISRTRSISVLRAKAVKETAQSMSMLQPIKPSSWRTITKVAGAPLAPTAWARSFASLPLPRSFLKSSIWSRRRQAFLRWEISRRLQLSVQNAGVPKRVFIRCSNVTANTTCSHAARPTVILSTDTFNNYFFPHTAQAAVEVLESAGYRVLVPETNLCCGRPLYDYGFLHQAKHNLDEILEALRPQITAGTPMVVLEPSCASVFRDELNSLMPNDEDAKRLRQQTFILSEFLNRIEYQPPTLKRKAVLHGHCHQKALFGMANEQKLLARVGLDAELLDSGCCGLAGSFGYEEDHYEVSMKVGERVLLPKVREAARDTLIVTDGFSCREQVMHGIRRHAMHLAEVIQMAMRQPSPDRNMWRPALCRKIRLIPL